MNQSFNAKAAGIMFFSLNRMKIANYAFPKRVIFHIQNSYFFLQVILHLKQTNKQTKITKTITKEYIYIKREE
jgi:hypothetical protein